MEDLGYEEKVIKDEYEGVVHGLVLFETGARGVYENGECDGVKGVQCV